MTGAGSDACTVTLTTAAGSGGLSVGLTSSNAAVTVPATVVVPANASSAVFTATVSSVTTAQAVTLTASAGSVSKSFALQLNAAVPTLTVSPTSLAFGNVTVNTASTLPVTLSSTGTAPVTINSAALSGTGFTVSGATFPVTLNPTQSVTLNVQFDPATAAAATGQLTIQSNSSTNGTAVVSLTGTGTAVPGSVECVVLQQRVDDGGGKRCMHGDADHGCRERRFECGPDEQQCGGYGAGDGGGSGQCDQRRVHGDCVLGYDRASGDPDGECGQRFQELCFAAECCGTYVDGQPDVVWRLAM